MNLLMSASLVLLLSIQIVYTAALLTSNTTEFGVVEILKEICSPEKSLFARILIVNDNNPEVDIGSKMAMVDQLGSIETYSSKQQNLSSDKASELLSKVVNPLMANMNRFKEQKVIQLLEKEIKEMRKKIKQMEMKKDISEAKNKLNKLREKLKKIKPKPEDNKETNENQDDDRENQDEDKEEIKNEEQPVNKDINSIKQKLDKEIGNLSKIEIITMICEDIDGMKAIAIKQLSIEEKKTLINSKQVGLSRTEKESLIKNEVELSKEDKIAIVNKAINNMSSKQITDRLDGIFHSIRYLQTQAMAISVGSGQT